MLSRRTFTQAIAAAAALVTVPAQADDRVIGDDAIRDILRRRIDAQKRSVGMAVGVVSERHRRFVNWGRARLADPEPVTSDTVFEIGSITKVFTALLLANMVRHGEVAFDDPVIRHLPGDFKLPDHGRPITLADLATHTAGLPRMPVFGGEPFSMAWRQNLARYTTAEFKNWLAAGHPALPPEAEGWSYSNAGYTLLGMALAHRAGVAFDDLLQRQILTPLRLRDTAFRPSPAMQKRLAESHGPDLAAGPPTELGIFVAGGGLLSTARDLARFAAALLSGSRSPIEAEARLLTTVRRPAPWMSGEQALGIEVRNAPGGSFLAKDGVTWGQTASLAFDPEQRVAVVVLSNTLPDFAYATPSSGGVGAADIAHHLLRPQIPMEGKGGARY